MFSYPWGSDDVNPFAFANRHGGGTVGSRAKDMIAGYYAYQRLPQEKLVNQALKTLQKFKPPREFPWAIPDHADVIYNSKLSTQSLSVHLVIHVSYASYANHSTTVAFGSQKCKAVEGFPNVKRDAVCPASPNGGGSGTSSSVSYVTSSPTYEPSGWTGFATATGNSTTDSIPIGSGSAVSSSSSLKTASFTLSITVTPPTTTIPSATTTTLITATATVSTTSGQTTVTVAPSTTSTPTTSTPAPAPPPVTTSTSTLVCDKVAGSKCCPTPAAFCEGGVPFSIYPQDCCTGHTPATSQTCDLACQIAGATGGENERRTAYESEKFETALWNW